MNSITHLSGYQIVESLYSGTRTLVYRGIRERDRQPVAIKVLRNPFPSFSELVQFRNQFTIAKNLNIPGIVAPYSLEPYPSGYALIMEDFGGISLRHYAQDHALSLRESLTIGRQLSEILHDLHQVRVIHKDIHPANILIHPDSKQVKLTDFSIASLLPRETQEIQNPSGLEGTLPYLAPEQSGRMNRGVDYRADFYALGVTLFELLTGQLPFQADDPMAWVHCHIAKQPPTVHQLNPDIPVIVADIVSKLMAKNAEDRYQTALGLHHDLHQCLEQLQHTGKIEPFPLASRDVSDRFLIPETLYGRAQDVQTLLDAFERVANGACELMLVAGFSGVGKTAVVNEVHKPMARGARVANVRQRGYFIKGKFDQFNRNIPFSALVNAFRDLMGQLLSESDAQLTVWKARILEAVGENGQVIIDVIPELERLIGNQPPVLELSGSAAQNRFNLLFQKFTQVFTTPEHPLVLFLDDLQWADAASLQFLQLLMQNGGYLLLLGAYRDNEVSPIHPLMVTVAALAKTGAIVNTITLQPLSRLDIIQLVADTLSCDRSLAQPLAELVYQKTQGNPFFATQLLKGLHQDGLIQFNLDAGYWQCNLSQIKVQSLTDDVVAFMGQQLQKLPLTTQAMLKLAACIGAAFDLQTLAVVSEQSEIETATALWEALQEGLILPLNQIYKFFQEETADSDTASTLRVPYRFLHDRVQQAAYALIPDQEKQVTHLHIGQLLLQTTPIAQREETIFDIVNQLNRGMDLMTHPQQQDLAQLNLMAGRRALASTAYTSALDYLTTGIALLAADPWQTQWQTQYELTLALYSTAAEAAYLSTEFDQVERLAATVLEATSSLADQVKLYEIKIQVLIAQNRLMDAIALGLSILDLLGVKFPKEPSQSDVINELQKTQLLWNDIKVSDLIELPEMTDSDKLVAMQILVTISAVSYIASPPLYLLIVFQQVNLSVTYGNTAASTYAYAAYGLILCGVVGDIALGYQFGQIALHLLQRLNAKALQSKIYVLVNCFIQPWHDHLRTTIAPLQESYFIGLEIGDLEFAAYSAFKKTVHLYLAGEDLATVEQDLTVFMAGVQKTKRKNIINTYQVVEQVICQLRSSWKDQEKLRAESVILVMPKDTQDASGICYFHCHQMILYYLLGENSQAMTHATLAEQYLEALTALFFVAFFYFYDSLIQLAGYGDVTPAEQETILVKVTANQQKMQAWAENAPMNFRHKFELVEAERHRVCGQRLEAMDCYDRAISAAKENGYIQEEALANELAARFYLDWGKETFATLHMQEAYYGYARWGAKAKTDDLEQRYAHLLTAIVNPVTPPLSVRDTITSAQTFSHLSASLDLATILKASQTLSSEIQMDRLLQTLVQLVVTSAGADKAVLFLNNNGSLELAIQYGDNAVQSLERQPLDQCQQIPTALIHYVGRTLETVITDYKTLPSDLNDPYCLQCQPQSLLCMPILKQGQLVAVLYVENAITANAFTRDRVELLNVLCIQAAISLENARLYSNLQASEARYQRLAENVLGVIYQFQITASGDWQIIYCSPSCSEMLEVSPEQAMADVQVIVGMVHPDDRAEFAQSIALSHQTLQPWQWVGRMVLPSGLIKWIQGTSRPERQDNGSIIWHGILVDITALKYLEQEQKKLNRILEATSDYIGIADSQGKALWLNHQFKQQFADLIDTKLHQLLISDFHPQWASEIVLNQGIPSAEQHGTWLGETALLDPTGREIPVSQLIIAHKSASGDVEHYSTIIRDISDRKAAEAALAESQKQYQNLVENSPDVIERFDLDLRHLYVSPALTRLTDVPAVEFLGKTCRDLGMDEAMVHAWESAATRLMTTGQKQVMEFDTPTLNGIRSFEMAIVPERSDQQTIESILCISRDISDRKQAEQQLQNLIEATAATTGQDFFPALVNHISKALNVAYALVTEAVDGKLQALAFWANGTLQPNFSYHPAKTPCEWALRDGKYYCETSVQQLFPQDLDLVEMGAESYLGIILQDSQGMAIGNLCILHTQCIQNPSQAETLLRVFAARAGAELERVRATQALEHLNRNLEVLVEQRTTDLMQRSTQLEASNKELESFSYSVSHDLRAPLRHMNGFVNALAQRLNNHTALTDPKVVHYLQVIEGSSQKMAQLIDGLLTLSRIGRKPLVAAPVPLRTLVDEAIALVQSNPETTVPVEFVIGELPTLQVDATLLQQVFSNLINNAVKFSHHNPAPRVEIGTLADGTVFVRDNGVGFQMDYVDKLFGAFQRLHAETEFEGTGIGLAIVQRIIHRHGGRIWAESQPDQGAVFYFTIVGAS